MPGGHIHDDEPVIDGLIREIKEEAGLDDIANLQELFTRDMQLGDTLRAVVFFSGVAESEDVSLSEEHTDYVWVEPEELYNYNLGVFLPVLNEVLGAQREFPEDPLSDALYEWIDNQVVLKQMEIPGGIPQSAKDIGFGIESSLYDSLWMDVDTYLDTLVETDSMEKVMSGLHEVVEQWLTRKMPEVENAFDALFSRGFAAGATVTTGMQIEDKNTMAAVSQGQYRLGERIMDFAEGMVNEFADVIASHFTEDGMISLDQMTDQLRDIVPEARYKLERIARTEVSNVTQVGRIQAWEGDPDANYYNYFWRSTPDNKRRKMKQIRSDDNPYSLEEIKFLWTHNEQMLPNGKWELGAINCRCTVTRSPSDELVEGNRFKGKEHLYRKTIEEF